ncbi:M48 family metalloprotease [Cribrihabitans neustonicus]|uniref:M48 family metalloprotease n=1 Tax=Cribrihabitans neustonicus TaxID=1429085 RepID=UPI003B5B73DD
MLISHGARMIFDRFSRLASIPALAVCAVLICLAPAVQAGSVALLRDADIEHGLNRLAAPVLRAAGLNPQRVRVLLVNDRSFNAFVTDSQTIFIHYGLVLKVDRARMLQAVIAHEAAHIANGHIGRRLENLRSARGAAGLGLALSVLAAAAGGGEAAIGIAAGTQSSALRGFLAHTRAEEASADVSAADYLRRAGISPEGLAELHRIFAGQEHLSAASQDPYMRSHPLSRDRLRAAEAYAAAHGGAERADPEAEYWFARLRGKLSAFVRAPDWTRRRAEGEQYADVRLMREAVAHHRQNRLDRALKSIDAAIAARPGDAFYHDLKGQILMENRRWQAAASAYGQAARLAPRDPLILTGLGRVQLAAGNPAAALKTLERARAIDFRNPLLLRDMSLAYARTGQTGHAALVTAERYALMGRLEDAGHHAKRASALLPAGSPGWRRAQDVLAAYEHVEKRKTR